MNERKAVFKAEFKSELGPLHHIDKDDEFCSRLKKKTRVYCNNSSDRMLGVWLIYFVVSIALCMNVYVLLNRVDTIFYLRLYQLVVSVIMLITTIVMAEFMWFARCNVAKLYRPHTVPRPMLFSGLMLTVGIVLGYAYFVVFNLTFQDCDELVDAHDPQEVWLEIIYDVTMIWFCILSFVYLMQRSYYGTLNQKMDQLRRLWINAAVYIVWLQVVVNKGYLSHQTLCQRKELNGSMWCPGVQRQYVCNTSQLAGTRQVWYYLNKGLLSSAVTACASEFFPVVLVAHWLVCGGAEERAEDLIRRQRQKKSVRRVLQRFITDISRVVGGRTKKLPMPPLFTSPLLQSLLIVAAWISGIFVVIQWFVRFYYTILFDTLHSQGWMVDYYVQVGVGIIQVIFHAMVFHWAAKVEERRFDAYHKAEARGDVVLILGCCILLTIKFVLQVVEMDYQKNDGFLMKTGFIMKVFGLLTTTGSQWLQFMSLRRILALSNRDIRSSRRFLPSIAIASFMANVVNFGLTYFETTIIKYQIGHEKEFGFSAVTLMSMIVTQIIYPADYLYAFTVAGCWMDLIYRYTRIGYFQLGPPHLDQQLEFDLFEDRRNSLKVPRKASKYRHSMPDIGINGCDSA
ncbi:unnamed protein product [Bursaphelenchus okinawaensis]|uniref:Uncharacterized protein n=1 Tax=Bursaphelenchus okinawaensis TaxID=465554 RepID=A0A811KU96_9BILA|nr:unnamed protein product [Bursaphelenchus okinawaensis]CAG9110505.1 unnamed protein product [Bursaphelenchus okinawaensis]